MRKFIRDLIAVFMLISVLLPTFFPTQTVNAAWRNYNRTEAVQYAKKWSNVSPYKNGYNPSWGNFSSMGGDCTNFVSQVLFAGGIPEDKSGSYQWYWDNMKPPSDGSGRSPSRSSSWAGVNELYTYIKYNTQLNGPNGPRGDVYAKRENMELGDIVQMDFNKNGSWDHSAVVTEAYWSGVLWWRKYVVKVTYHQTDTLNRNLDDITNTNFRYIKIWGSDVK